MSFSLTNGFLFLSCGGKTKFIQGETCDKKHNQVVSTIQVKITVQFFLLFKKKSQHHFGRLSLVREKFHSSLSISINNNYKIQFHSILFFGVWGKDRVQALSLHVLFYFFKQWC